MGVGGVALAKDFRGAWAELQEAADEPARALAGIKTISKVRDCQFVSGSKPACPRGSAVDPGAVLASEVTDAQNAVMPGQAAMQPRYAGRVNPCVAAQVAPNEKDRAGQRNVCDFVQ
jgi:hypothetical protein